MMPRGVAPHEGYGKADCVCVCVPAVAAQRLQGDENYQRL